MVDMNIENLEKQIKELKERLGEGQEHPQVEKD